MKVEKKQVCVALAFIGLLLSGVFICLCLSGTAAHAAGLVDDVINPEHLYSKYGLSNYQLDFYVDNSWGWLPWNWKSGIGKQVMYGIYLLTNVLWTLSIYISYGTGYVVQQAYELDFVNDMADRLGASIQTLIGITPNGVTRNGIFYRVLPLIILMVGAYMIYVGLVKHETSKAVQTCLNMTVVCILTMAFVVGAPSYIKMINGLSSDISTAVLDAGSRIVLSGEEGDGGSVDKMRDNLFSIQILQPWLLLQYGTTDMDAIGAERVENLLSKDPAAVENNTNTREEVVKDEIANKGNSNLSTGNVGMRLAMVFFLLILNIGISVFVFLLTGLMLLSQLLFIMFSVFLIFSFVISMIPGQEGKWKQAAVKTFNTILTRSGIALVTTVAFCLSTLVYSMSETYPFFMVAFLQIVIFAGTAYKLNDFLGMFSMQSNDSQNLGRRMIRRPYMFMRRQSRRMGRRLERNIMAGIFGRKASRRSGRYQKDMGNSTGRWQTKSDQRGNYHTRAEKGMKPEQRTDTAFGRAGAKVGAVMDAPQRMAEKGRMMKNKVRDIPTNVRYGTHKAKEDFKGEITAEQRERKEGRASIRQSYQENMNAKKDTLQKNAEKRHASRRGMMREQDMETGQEQTQQERTEEFYENRSRLQRGQDIRNRQEQMEQKRTESKQKEKKQTVPKQINQNHTNQTQTNRNQTKQKQTIQSRQKGEKQKPVCEDMWVKDNKTLSKKSTVKGTRLSAKENRKTKWNDLGELPKNAGLNQCVNQRPEVREWENRRNLSQKVRNVVLERSPSVKNDGSLPQQIRKNPEIHVARHTPVIQNLKTGKERSSSTDRREMKTNVSLSSKEEKQTNSKANTQRRENRKERKE